ncbi:hypothetical protein [Streptomyces sp. DvalAA-19]|uniref:hypothetical protein n=1 Tax=Streptomyces sp. DvalAA-19 TaxID=1839761 RepID=UPI00081B651C|nr:hypothetical protein [Streptomyces sp. DvalAA-19]SCD64571.1 hypothetical protein GA0115244_10766 [Streptomyces sp. DvalAA-19]
MSDGVDAWNRLAALLPPAQGEEFEGCWAIGEQEAGLGLLVSGLLSGDVAIGETVRAQISVLTEVWGEREALAPGLRRCRGDGGPGSAVRLIERDDVHVGGDTVAAARSLSGLVLVPWIDCARCGRVLMRAHAREPWGDLSFAAGQYVITTPDRTVAVRLLPADAAEEAFTGLLQDCGHQPTRS